MTNYLIDYYYRDEDFERISTKQTDEVSAKNESLAVDELHRKRGFNLEIFSIFKEEN